MKPYYESSGITLYHGSYLDDEALADFMVTDPPYGMGYKSRVGKSMAGDEDTAVRDAVIAKWGAGPALVFGHWKAPRPVVTRMVLYWDKGDWPGMGDLSLPWGPSVEEIYVLGAGFVGKRTGQVLRHPRLNHQLRSVLPADETDQYRRTAHPTEKPVGLMELLLRACPGTILDPFAGSGSTLVAAKGLGKIAVGYEIEERYCEIAANRLSQVLPW